MTEAEEFELMEMEMDLHASSAPNPSTKAAMPAQVEQPKRDTGLETGRQRKPVVTGQIRNSPMDIAADQAAGNLTAGLVRGAGSIGATILLPADMINQKLRGEDFWSLKDNRQRRADMDGGLQTMGADTDSGLYTTGKIVGEIAGTAGVGGALANGARAVGAAPAIVNTLASGGMNASGVTGLSGMLLRGAGGAAVGGTAAGMVNPEDAGMGAIVGGSVPVAAKVVGATMQKAGAALRGDLSPEVVALAKRAKDLGVDIPVDRITNSKPLNAVASSLEYMPFSGRAATMSKTNSQLNTALSRTFGQDSDNVTMALRKAGGELGGKFDDVLQNNTLRVDQAFLDDLAEHASRSSKELGSDGARIIQNQIDEIIAKGSQGDIDGQAAYNIKKTLDRIGKRNSPEAYYALDLKKSLMGALDRSLGPQEAAAFAKTRQQYGNMLQLEKIAKNGAEGDISVARLANMKNINNKDLQELADIASQFMITRESPHGALQRLVIGGTGVGLSSGAGALPLLAATAAGGRVMNSALNSNTAKSLLMNSGTANPQLLDAVKKGLLGVSKAAPVLTAQ